MSFRLRIAARSDAAGPLVSRLSAGALDDVGRRIERDFGLALRKRLMAHVGERRPDRSTAAVIFEARFADAAGVLDVEAASVPAVAELLGPEPTVYEAFVRVYAPLAFADVLAAAGLPFAVSELSFESAVSPAAWSTLESLSRRTPTPSRAASGDRSVAALLVVGIAATVLLAPFFRGSSGSGGAPATLASSDAAFETTAPGSSASEDGTLAPPIAPAPIVDDLEIRTADVELQDTDAPDEIESEPKPRVVRGPGEDA